MDCKDKIEFDEIESCECIGTFEDEYVYDLEMDDTTHTFIINDVLVHNSLYCNYGDLIKCFTDNTRPKTKQEKLDWILKFNQEFLDKKNKEWLDERFNSRHGHNIHNFELETVAKSGIFLSKKKYTQDLAFSKGNYYIDKPKIKSKGVEIIQSSTPKLARKILKELSTMLLTEFTKENINQFTIKFVQKLKEYKKEWYNAPLEDISNTQNVGNYYKYVIEDKEKLVLGERCPKNIHAIARFNYLAYKNGEGNLCIYSGKIKYYNLPCTKKENKFFGYPAGELPSWAPECDRGKQFDKCVISPLNRFCEALHMPDMNLDCAVQFSMF